MDSSTSERWSGWVKSPSCDTQDCSNSASASINRLKDYGGSINAAKLAVAEGKVYQSSGHAAFGMGIPGNPLLAFAVKR